MGVQQRLGHGGQAGVDLGHVGDFKQLVLVSHDGGQVASGVGVEVEASSCQQVLEKLFFLNRTWSRS